MDQKKIQRAAYLSPRSDKARIIILIVLAAVVCAAFFYFRDVSKQQSEASSVEKEEYANIPPTRVEVSAKVDPAVFASVRDASISERVVKEKEPYLHLIKQSAKLIPGDMEILGVRSADPEAILKDPASFRGKPILIKGNLQYYETEKFEDFELFKGYLTTLKGRYVYFTVLSMPDEFSIGDVVKLQGFFFKIYSFVLHGEETRVSDALFIVGRRLVSSFYTMKPVHEIDPAVLDSIYDYTLEDSSKDFQEKPLYHLLSYVQNLDSKKIETIPFSEHLASEVMFSAAKFRGKALDIVGKPVWLRRTLLGPEGENPLKGVRKVYRGLVLNYKGGFCYFFALDIPEWFSTDFKNLVHLKGFFFRNFSYISRKGTPQSAPVLVVCSIEKYLYPKDETIFYITLFIFGLTILMVGFFFFTVFRDRKHNREYRARFIAKKKELLQRAIEQKAAGSSRKTEPDEPAPEEKNPSGSS